MGIRNGLRNTRLNSAIKGSFLDNANEEGFVIAATAANSVVSYASVHDSLPDDETKAASIGTMRNMLGVDRSANNEFSQQIMDSATSNMSSQDGIIKRNHQVALVIPVALMQATNPYVTYIPPEHDRSEIFVIHRKAGSTFGELHRGDIIDETFNQQYSTMDQLYEIGEGDGSKKIFPFKISELSINKAEMPIRKGYVRVYHDLDLAGKDDPENGLVSGVLEVNGVMITVGSNNSINYDTGEGEIAFSVAPEIGVPINLSVDIDIEKAPQLIPLIEHGMSTYVVRPHEGAITVSESIQSVFAAKREFGLELRGMQLTAARNSLAAEKDRKRLRMMWMFAKIHQDWPRLAKSALSRPQHYEGLKEFFGKLSTAMMQRNKKSGIKAIFLGLSALNIVKAAPGFKLRSNYQEIPQPHFVGHFNGIAVHADPSASPWKGLAIAKGSSYGDSGFIAADAISAIQYQHAILNPSSGQGKGMQHSDTLYELSYRDIHPYRGREYFATFEFVNEIGE